jgi:hypothetical protein
MMKNTGLRVFFKENKYLKKGVKFQGHTTKNIPYSLGRFLGAMYKKHDMVIGL